MRGVRRVAVPLVVLLAAGLVGCSPALPESVVPDTLVSAGWTGEFTSTNAVASPTAGNLDVAAMTRGRFGDVVDGEFVADESFGTITIVSDDQFIVRYDLAEPSWSDGIPLDGADLILGWAGNAGYFPVAEDGEDAEQDLEALAEAPAVDEFARAIEVAFPQPTILWQTAVTVPVPAHVVGERAFGLNDPMEAKQAVIAAIQDADTDAIAAIGKVWNEAFTLPETGEAAEDVMLSSGPYLVDTVDDAEDGQSVSFVPNPAYKGIATSQVAQIDLLPVGEDPVGEIGTRLDVAQTAPVASNRSQIHQLEREDYTVATTNDGTLWSLRLDSTAGVFADQKVRSAFLRTVPARSLVDAGAGDWASSYTATTSMLAAPGSRAYDIVNEDSGFTQSLGTAPDEPALAREAAGVAAGTRVCVLYDRGSEFAKGAFLAVQEAVKEAGWTAVDCGSDDYRAALEAGAWDAVIGRTAIPQTPAQIATQWGTDGTANVTGSADADRDEMIATYAQTTDVYDARDRLAQIESSIVRDAVALPIAANPVITVNDRDVSGVAVRNGRVATLTAGAVQWAVEKK